MTKEQSWHILCVVYISPGEMRGPSIRAHILPQGLMGERLAYDSVICGLMQYKPKHNAVPKKLLTLHLHQCETEDIWM